MLASFEYLLYLCNYITKVAKKINYGRDKV